MITARTQTRATRRALIEQVPNAVRRFLSTEAAGAALLLAATVAALTWANSPWSDAYVAVRHTEASIAVGAWSLSMDVEHWVNDGLMALFFFVVGLEVRREFSVGELRQTSRARIPLLAAVGGVTLPALVFALLAPPDARHAWGVVVGTDTAFMLAALAVVGPRFATQLRIFLLTLTVIDDIVAVGVIGFVYSADPDPRWFVPMAACGAVIWGLCRAGQWRVWPYAAAGIALWYVTLSSGLHAAMAGMLGGLLVGAYEPPQDVVERAAGRFRAFRQSPDVDLGRSARLELERAISVNERLQLQLHPWASYVVVPLFAFVNAGVDLRGGVLAEALAAPLTWAIVVALVVGKTVGIAGTALGAARLRLGGLPQGVRAEHVVGGAALSGIGFTVSLLIAGLAFDDQRLRAEATVGVLIALVVATALGAVVFQGAAWLTGQPDADLPRTLDRPVDPAVDHLRGAPDAPLTLVEYGDFECPYCARATGVAEELRAHFGPELRYVFRHLPLTDVHPHAFLAAQAALAADRQGRFWEMHDLMFARQSALELEDLAGYAEDLGLDVDAFLRDLEDPEIAVRIRSDVASAEASGARGTPTFFVGVRRHTGPHDTRTLIAALEAARDG